MNISQTARAYLVLVTLAFVCGTAAWGQDARTLRAQAQTETNQEKQVALLCKAADLDANNKDYRKDCQISKSALIAADRQSLKTAQDADDAGQPVKAKRYARYVSSLDPELHRQAEQLLTKLDTPAAPVVSDTQKALLAQATAAYQSGNLQAARLAAQAVTEPSLKPAASQILADMERYNGLVSAGARHEQAKEFAEAERSYESALALNSHAGADELAGKAAHMRQLAASGGQPPPVVSKREPAKPVVSSDPKVGKLAPEVSPEDKKKRLLDESAQALSRNDLDTAGRKFKQVLDLDPANAEAKRGLAAITAALNRDPVQLEKTLREALVAFYASHFEDAESRLNRYLGADGGKKKGAAYFYLGATETTLALLDDASKRAARTRQAREDFNQARLAGYQPVDRYVSTRVLAVWAGGGMTNEATHQ